MTAAQQRDRPRKPTRAELRKQCEDKEFYERLLARVLNPRCPACGRPVS